MKHDIFISYSRKDKDIIEPVVKLIRALIKDRVFQDVDNIIAGKKWEPQLMQAIINCKIVIVFWCEHSLKSANVRKEYKFAIQNKKD